MNQPNTSLAKEAGHTPGPWTIKANYQMKGINHLAITGPNDAVMVCSITPMHLRRDEDDANARLIEAAPEQHQELIELEQLLADYVEDEDKPDMAAFAEHLVTVRRLIAKAKGGV